MRHITIIDGWKIREDNARGTYVGMPEWRLMQSGKISHGVKVTWHRRGFYGRLWWRILEMVGKR